ncbi:MAG: transcriptional regulator [Treponema sp.]|nr:transcriptional regulator [Treponema sp.]
MSSDDSPINSIYKMQAAEDFTKARGKAVLSQIQHFLNADKDKLLSFNDVKEILKPKNEVYKGMQVVPIKLIVGSEGRYRDFNKYFLPRAEYLRNRWERVDQARLEDMTLPPIRLYEIGGAYFVRDGNHRVSVARTQGGESIDAEVTSLASEITITPSMTVDELRDQVLHYEKELFYEKTSFGKLTDDYDLDFSTPGQYEVIYNHILVHKYYLNQHIDRELPFSDALFSWYNNVYAPIIQIIKEEWIQLDFPGNTPSDLYVWIVKYWDSLKQKYDEDQYSMTDAARDFSVKYGKPRGRFFRFLGALIDQFVNFGK